MTNNDNKHRLAFKDKEIILLGTAHVSKESADLVARVIEEEKPDTVAIELCESRYQALTQKNKWQDTDLIKVIKEKKAFLLLSNLMLASFQKKIGQKLGIKPGEEMLRAIEAAKSVDAHVHLADRNIRITLSRTWRLMGLWTKIKLLAQFVASMGGGIDDITEEDIEKMKKKDVLETLLSEIGQKLPELQHILIDERDQYLVHKIRTAPGKRIVAVVGAGHVPGIQKYLNEEIDMDALDQMPPKGRLSGILKWGIPALIIGLIVAGFFFAGSSGGVHMIKWWVLANAVFAGLGAAIALGHPLTVLSAIAAAPLTSLNPMIAAGWVSGLVETLIGTPKVKDFESLPDDIVSARGFWTNKITKILLVVVFTNIGSSIGTFVALPMMIKVFT
ncbi:MAG: TraB/GumN family protein [Deltaproteobacteria bacterium]|nr:TraB/GumN family protein [Deltaproteobacteria bacterium]MBW2344135.1 TraB/GumN family protein [Deltaproteobacteria bacterium]